MSERCPGCGGPPDFRPKRKVCRACERKRWREYYDRWTPEYRAQRLARKREQYRMNPGPANARSREYYERNPLEAHAAGAEWVKANPDLRREIARRHSNMRRATILEVFVERVEPLVVLERDDGVCGICGEDVDPTNYHVDHVIPLSKGGLHSYANTQTAHPLCNIRKNAKVD